jgi:protein-S-isoprenylcysteine O-methyltransferase Ste14
MKQGYNRRNHEFRKDLAGEYRWGDTGQIVFLIIFFSGMISDVFIFKFSDAWQPVIPWYVRMAFFILMLLISGYFIQRSHKIVTQQERDELLLINTDVYALLRHPLYFGSILFYLGFVILSLSVIALIVFVFIVVFYFYLCRFEEQILLEKLGGLYKKYKENVPMFLPLNHIKATRIVVVAFALLCGFTGIIAGYYELLQGNVTPDGLIISTIGPEYNLWTSYSIYDLMEPYSAVTIIPNFFLTGIAAIIVSCLVIIWAIGIIHRKYGVIIFLFLSIIQLLVGGAFVMDMAILTCITATRINKPLRWWRSHLPDKVKKSLALLWPWSLMVYIVISIILLGIPIAGLHNEDLLGYLDSAAILMFIPIILMITGGFACDMQRHILSN